MGLSANPAQGTVLRSSLPDRDPTWPARPLAGRKVPCRLGLYLPLSPFGSTTTACRLTSSQTLADAFKSQSTGLGAGTGGRESAGSGTNFRRSTGTATTRHGRSRQSSPIPAQRETRLSPLDRPQGPGPGSIASETACSCLGCVASRSLRLSDSFRRRRRRRPRRHSGRPCGTRPLCRPRSRMAPCIMGRCGMCRLLNLTVHLWARCLTRTQRSLSMGTLRGCLQDLHLPGSKPGRIRLNRTILT